MAVKIAKAMGTEVTVLSTSERKRQDAMRLGATDFALTSQADTFTRLQRRFDFILDTVSAPHNYNAYVRLLKTDGTMILVGLRRSRPPWNPFPSSYIDVGLPALSSAASAKRRRCSSSARSTESNPMSK